MVESAPDLIVRPSWDQWLIGLAIAVSTRADCTRRQIGAVILDSQHRVLSVGYNGAPSGAPGCLTDGACPRGQLGVDVVAPGSSYDTGAGSCISIHAEPNAIMFADPERRRGGTMGVSDAPCGGCERIIMGSGLARVIWPGGEWVL